MTVSELDRELAKFDVSVSPVENEERALDLNFIIKHVTLQSLGMNEEGIAVVINRYRPDKFGKTGSAYIENVYPLSLEGLEAARQGGLKAVTDMYNLPKVVCVVEDFANASTIEDDDKVGTIVRIDPNGQLKSVRQAIEAAGEQQYRA